MTRSKLALVCAVGVVAAGGAVGCGSDDEPAASSGTQTVPDERVGATNSTVQQGLYAGVLCEDARDEACLSSSTALPSTSKEGALAACGGLVDRKPDRTIIEDSKGRQFVCFRFVRTSSSKGEIREFFVGGDQKFTQVDQTNDRFPWTGANGLGVKGEWFSGTRMAGTYGRDERTASPYFAIRIAA